MVGRVAARRRGVHDEVEPPVAQPLDRRRAALQRRQGALAGLIVRTDQLAHHQHLSHQIQHNFHQAGLAGLARQKRNRLGNFECVSDIPSDRLGHVGNQGVRGQPCRSRDATCARTRSPIGWPWRSFTCLKSSMSTRQTLNVVPC